MKDVFSIGRDYSCDIVLQDDSNVISRVHAFLRVRKGGKYTISDQSMNGTYVNGIRITSGVEVPVSRKDVVSFAHVEDLDWSQIPNPQKRKTVILFSCLAVLLIIAASLFFFLSRMDSPQESPQENILPPTDSTTVVADTVKIQKPEKSKEFEGIAFPLKEKKKTEKKTAKKPVSQPAKETPKDRTETEKEEPVEKPEQLTEEVDTVQQKKVFDSIY